MNSEPYYDYRRFLEALYGETVYRIPIDFGLGCPHRDVDGSGGCTFCAAAGARAKQTLAAETVAEQVQTGIAFARGRYGARLFTAYIQAFTGTFASASWQREQYEKLLQQFPFTAVNIGTRPDCLSAGTLAFLEELRERLDVWVELGVQSVHNRTLQRVNRGHSWEQSKDAIAALKERGVRVAAHVILGLPGEEDREFCATAEALNQQAVDAVKVHNLHVLKGSRLAEEYRRGRVDVFNEHAYAEVLVRFLRRLSPHFPVMRLVTDSENSDLVAPHWEMRKGQFLEYLDQLMRLRNVCQGDLVSTDVRPTAPKPSAVRPKPAPDGSFTFWNVRYKEHYHCPLGARAEAREKYLQPSGLASVLQHRDAHVLDICFGMGYNSLAACNQAVAVGKHRLNVTALDIDRVTVARSAAYMSARPEDLFSWADVLWTVYETARSGGSHFSIQSLWGDARYTIGQIPADITFDAVFLDPFSPQRNTALWTVEFFEMIRRRLAPHGRLLTYSTAIPVRSGLRTAGFFIGNIPAFGREKGGTMAALTKNVLPLSIGQEDEALIKTAKGIPYRDPHGTRTDKDILREREERVRAEKAAMGGGTTNGVIGRN